MHYQDINSNKKQSKKRKGRGMSAGQDKTAGRGTKGQNSRSGSKGYAGFIGGQTPLMQQLPKIRGFNAVGYGVQQVTTGMINKLSAKTITNQTLFEAGLIRHAHKPVKLINKGELTTAKTVQLQRASHGAQTIVESAGGTFTATELVRTSKKKEATTK